MEELKKMFHNFDEIERRFVERNRVNGDEYDAQVDMLAKMVGVFKAYAPGEDGEEGDLEESLRLVSEGSNNLNDGPFKEFAKVFVYMHTNVLDTRLARNPTPSVVSLGSSSFSSYSSSLCSTTSSKRSDGPNKEKIPDAPPTSPIPCVGPLPSLLSHRGRGRPPKKSLNAQSSHVSFAESATSTRVARRDRGVSTDSNHSESHEMNETMPYMLDESVDLPSTSRRTSTPSNRSPASSSRRHYSIFNNTPGSKKKIELVNLDSSSEEDAKVTEDTAAKKSIVSKEIKEEEVETVKKRRRTIAVAGVRMEEVNKDGKPTLVMRRRSAAHTVPAGTPKRRLSTVAEEHTVRVPRANVNNAQEATVAGGTVEASDEAKKNGERKKRTKTKGDNLRIDMVDARLADEVFEFTAGGELMTAPVRHARGAKNAAAAKLVTKPKEPAVKKRGRPNGRKRNGKNPVMSAVDRARQQTLQFERCFSPRSKKARVALRECPLVVEPDHAGRGGDAHWACGGKDCTRHFEKSSDVYRHMLQEHYLEGAIAAKCLDCGIVGQFIELILHRKKASPMTCGGSHAKLAYWSRAEEEKDETEMDEEEMNMKKERDDALELSKVLLCCLHKGCDKRPFTTFELLAKHNEEVHKTRIRYCCPNKLCNRTFTHPLGFIRHRQLTCQGAVPDIKAKPIVEVKTEE